MAKTIEDLQNLLAAHGYACQQMFDVIVGTQVPTKTYKSPAGEQALDILLSFDRPNDCVAVEIIRAFDLRKAQHREATLACVLSAAARTPLLRAVLDPADGEIRLRVDCPCGPDGASDEQVLQAVHLLACAVEAWYPEVTAAMEEGAFDANNVTRITLARLNQPGLQKPDASEANDAGPDPAAEDEQAAGDEQAADQPARKKPGVRETFRAAAIAHRPGAQPSRLKVLFDFKKWLDENGRNFGNQN